MQGKGSYSIVQFSPQPERIEYVNVGVFLMVPERSFFRFKINPLPSRVEKLFGSISSSYYKLAIEALQDRVYGDSSLALSQENFEKFASLRSNDVRLTKLQQIVVDEKPHDLLDRLYLQLVAEKHKPDRSPRAQLLLKEKFLRAGVYDLLDRPAPVVLPQGVKLDVPFAYQNGSYNLIDPVRIDQNLNLALDKFGRRAIEGAWLHDYSHKLGQPKRLVVVGDFSKSGEDFFKAVRSQLAANNVKLHRFDDLDPLFSEIRASRH